MPKSHEYWDEIRALAAIYNDQEALEVEAGEGADRDEWLWETIDSHEFIIYIGHAQEVLQISPNDQVYPDEFGEPVDFHNPAPGAMAAMMADIRDHA